MAACFLGSTILELELAPLPTEINPTGLAYLRVCNTYGVCLCEYWRPIEEIALPIETLQALTTIRLVVCPTPSDYIKLYSYPHLQRLIRQINGYDQFLFGT